MVYPSNFEQKLGFDIIRQLIKEHCLSSSGHQYVNEICFSEDREEIVKLLTYTEEFRKVLLFDEGFPSQDYYDMTSDLLRIRIEGTYMEPEQLSTLKLSLFSIMRILTFFNTRPEEKYPELYSLAREISIESSILQKTEKIIDEKSNIRDDASPALRKIRKDHSAKQAIVEKKIKLSLRAASKAGWTPEDAGITVRDGRLVIPILAKYKRQLSGFVHDESSTGQTVYLEPTDVLETNNEIRELEYAERREIIRILIKFADFLRPYIDDLLQAYHFLGFIDFIRAKALFAISINASYPGKVENFPVITWNEAVHPLLYLSHTSQNKLVVPMTLSLNSSERILVVSGPNAGGKSVCLKTVGLLQYMLQCGLLPSAKENSGFGVFKKIFVDIGDEQSLENDLSTYTSKLLNIKYFLENLDKNSLFLIDEFGTGTDPGLGGAIAEASLEKFNEQNSFGVVTTHYSNLKLLAGKLNGVINGAMLFDSGKMKPLYQLKIGNPGSSFAFEIANQIGFPKDVLKNAALVTGKKQLDYEKELQDIEVEKNEIAKKAVEIKVADEFLDELIKKYQKLTEELEKSKYEILLKAREDALHLLSDSNKVIEKTIKEIKESQADKEITKKGRAEVDKLKEDLRVIPDAPGLQKPEPRKQKSETILIPTQQPQPYQGYIDDFQQKLVSFQLTIDLRGKRADEALSLLQRYIDEATLLSIPEVRILHGKGNGILRQITREYLGSIKEVKKYNDEAPEHGGPGITIVTFK